jgi:hypothetical protein
MKISLLSRRTLIQLAVSTLLIPATSSANAQIALATAINRTARFRSLSQRATKAYAQIALNVMPDSAQKILLAVQKLIQQGFDDIGMATFSAETAKQVDLMRSEAKKLSDLISGPPKREQLLNVSNQADKLLIAANSATQMLVASAKSNSSKIEETAARQRMLSQRLAKNYFLTVAEVNASAAAQQIAADKKEFKEALVILQKSPISTQGIRDDLELCNAQWLLFEAALDLPKTRADAQKDVATTSERLLEVANNLTEKYEKALKDVLG